MWFANSAWIDGPISAEYLPPAEGQETRPQIDLRYGEVRILLSPAAALATMENLRAALEASGYTPIEVTVTDESEEGHD